MPALALDIGTYTIKAISGTPGDKVEITRVAEIFNPHNVSVPTDEVQVQKMAELLNTFIQDNKLPISDVRLSLPESIVSSKVISIPRLSDAELASAIGWQAEQYIPIPPEELALEYQVLYRPERNSSDEQMRVLLIGVRKPIIEAYMSMFQMLSIEPTLMETQMLSVIRSVQFEKEDVTSLVVHIGASAMSMAVVHEGEVVFIFNHMSGAQMLTRTLEQSVGLTAEQAEQYKRAYGLNPAQFQGKVAAALQPAVKVLVTEMQKSMRFFLTKYAGSSVKRLILSGGGAQMPGLVQELATQIGAETLIVAPFTTATGAIPEANHPALSVCMGLLMREL